MKTVIKPVYYCEFCNKKGLSAGAMAKHEKHCTLNPNRECRMCDEDNNIPELVAKFSSQLKIRETVIDESGYCGKYTTIDVISHPKIEDILASVDGCPMCTLAILRQAGLNTYYLKEKIPFDYQKAKAERWSEKNAEAMREEFYY